MRFGRRMARPVEVGYCSRLIPPLPESLPVSAAGGSLGSLPMGAVMGGIESVGEFEQPGP